MNYFTFKVDAILSNGEVSVWKLFLLSFTMKINLKFKNNIFSFRLIDFQNYIWYNYLNVFHFDYYVIARGVINADK